jgi:AAA family ATP:ADP antiporter
MTRVRAEAVPVLSSAAVVFCLFASYNIQKALRDAIGAEDVRNLSWLWTGTLGAMCVAAPVYAALVSRFPRRVFLPLAYRAFSAVLLAFYAAMAWLPPGALRTWADRAFYVWVAVVALYGPTIFWGFMADVYRSSSAKRLYGPIASGASLGSIAGSWFTAQFAADMGSAALLLVAIVLLESSAQLVGALNRMHRGAAWGAPSGAAELPVGGGIVSGMKEVFESSYLARFALHLFLFTATSAVLQIVQAKLVAEQFPDRAGKTEITAQIQLVSNVLAFLVQLFVTPRALRWFGLAACLAFLPAYSALGFGLFALWPAFAVVIVFGVLRQGINYGLMKPSQEVLFTVVPREQKYKSKAFVDTVVYRGGDSLSAWVFEGLEKIGASLSAIAWLVVPVSLAWGAVALALGRAQARRARELEGDPRHGSA